MSSKRQTWRHIFSGGFATDFGPSANVGPDQGGNVMVPFLRKAENVFFELDGGPHKIGGTSKLNSGALEAGAAIRGLFDYWRQGTSLAPTQQRIVHVSTKVYADDGAGAFSQIGSGFSASGIPSYTVFEDKLILASDAIADVPMVYDQTTLSTLDATGPNFSFSTVHKNHAWAAGVPAFPSRLYYSAQFDPTKWDTDISPDATAGHIDIDPSDGDRITGIRSYKDNLWVFKGPYKGSIHRITGSANTGSDAYNRTTFITGLGAISHNTIFHLRDDLGFMWSDGTIHSLNATAAYGDFNESALSRPIHLYLRQHLNHTFLKTAWAATDVSRSIVVFCVPFDGSTTPNQCLMMDFARQSVWWATWPALPVNCIARVIDQSQTNQPVLMVGGSDGFVRKTNAANRAIDGSTAIAATVDTPFNNYGSAQIVKTLAGASVGIAPKGNYSLQIGWTRDSNAQQTDTQTQGGGDVLGPATVNPFTLDTSQLGGSQYVDRFFNMESGGEYRSLSLEFYNGGLNEDLEVHSVTTSNEIGPESQEAAL